MHTPDRQIRSLYRSHISLTWICQTVKIAEIDLSPTAKSRWGARSEGEERGSALHTTDTSDYCTTDHISDRCHRAPGNIRSIVLRITPIVVADLPDLSNHFTDRTGRCMMDLRYLVEVSTRLIDIICSQYLQDEEPRRTLGVLIMVSLGKNNDLM